MLTETTVETIRLVIVSNGCPLPECVSALLSSGRFEANHFERICDVGKDVLSDGVDAVLVLNTDQDDEHRAVIARDAARLIERVGGLRLGVLLITPDVDGPHDAAGSASFDAIGPETSNDELLGRLSTLARYRPMLEQLDHELNNMHRLGKRLNRHFTEIDQEMRLASRLQCDFLPQELPTIGGIQISTIYRPASWVSGDIYDVCRIDEKHASMYVADAVGHGMAAALLTMFIKRAIVPKRVNGGGYELLAPGEILAHLNDSLKSQNLPNCQFVTACYCLYNVETRELQVARGGHPYPIRIGIDGRLSEIRSDGGLLGLFGGEEFETISTTLNPGEKLLLYSDGIEMAFREQQDSAHGQPRCKKELQSVARLPARELVRRLTGMLDSEEGSLNPHDDVTVIVLETPK